MIYYLASLLAAACWALSGIISKSVVNEIGAIRFSRWRMGVVFVSMAALSVFWPGWEVFANWRIVFLLLLSGFIGIFLGDSALFLTLQRLGPRRTSILFSMNAPITVLLGLWVLGESWDPVSLVGILLVLGGVVLAIIYGSNKQNAHQWDQVEGKLWIGVLLGFFAAFCQSVGILISKPIMEQGADPIIASVFRVGIAALCLQFTYFSKTGRSQARMTWSIFFRITVSGTLGMFIGMSLIMFALRGGSSGIVSTLSSTTPVLVLPLLWMATGKKPVFWAWMGALLCCAGTAFIFIR